MGGAQSLHELEGSARYSTCRQNTITIKPDKTVLLQQGLNPTAGTTTVVLDGLANGTSPNPGKELSISSGAGQPPRSWTDAYRVRIALTTPQLSSAVKHAGKSTAVCEIVVEVHPEWAAQAAARFRLLVEQQFLVGCRFFCVVPNFVAQVGLHSDPRVGIRWLQMPIADDPVRQKNTKGRLSFISLGPNTRTSQIFINLGDNSIPGRLPTGTACGILIIPPTKITRISLYENQQSGCCSPLACRRAHAGLARLAGLRPICRGG